jgi:MFS family permease
MSDGATAGAGAIRAPITKPMRRIATAVAAHVAVGMYSGFGAPLMTVIEDQVSLSPMLAAWLLGLGAFTSGIVQPAASLIADRWNSRFLAWLGLAMAAVFMSLLGAPSTAAGVFCLFSIGTIGIGVFNPVVAATIGQIASALGPRGRSIGVSIFYAAGLLGGIIGSLVAPLFSAGGAASLRWMAIMMIAGLAIVPWLRRRIKDVDHRDMSVEETSHRAARRRNVTIQLAGNALRFTAHLSIVYLFLRWSDVRSTAFGGTADASSSLSGLMIASMLVGMALGTLVIGASVPPGRESRWLVAWPLTTWPVILLFPWFSSGGGVWAGIGAALAALAFAPMIPVAVAVTQRMWPHRSSLASSMALGGAWSVSVLGPPLAEAIVQRAGFEAAFAMPAALLAASGLLALALDRRLIRETAPELIDGHSAVHAAKSRPRSTPSTI